MSTEIKDYVPLSNAYPYNAIQHGLAEEWNYIVVSHGESVAPRRLQVSMGYLSDFTCWPWKFTTGAQRMYGHPARWGNMVLPRKEIIPGSAHVTKFMEKKAWDNYRCLSNFEMLTICHELKRKLGIALGDPDLVDTSETVFWIQGEY